MISLNYRSSRPRRAEEQEYAPPPPPPPRPNVEVRRSGPRQMEPKPTQEVRNQRAGQGAPRGEATDSEPPPRRTAEPRYASASEPPPRRTAEGTGSDPYAKEYRRPRPGSDARPPHSSSPPRTSPPPRSEPPISDSAETAIPRRAKPTSSSSSKDIATLLRSREYEPGENYKELTIAILMMLVAAGLGLVVANLT